MSQKPVEIEVCERLSDYHLVAVNRNGVYTTERRPKYHATLPR